MIERRWFLLVVAAVAAGTLSEPLAAQRASRALQGPAQKAPVRAERTVPFTVGEALTYEISWSSFVTAGSATMSVKEKRPSYSSVAYYIVAEGRPVPLLAKLYDLYYKADTLLDTHTLLPQRASLFSRRGRRQQMKTTMFNRRTNTASYEVQTTTLVKTSLRVPASAQDPLGAIYVLRTRSLKPGERFSVPICDAGETYSVDVSVAAPEPVTSGIGDVRAWRITPRLPKEQAANARGLTLWLSDDARRLPVKLQAQLAVGTFDLTLRSVGK